jgi:hypothetical protein
MMTIPYREWLNFQHWSAHYSSTAGYDDTRPNWIAGREDFCKAGWRRTSAAPNVYTEWRGLARPVNNFDVDLVNLNLCFDFQADVYELLSTRTAAGVTHVHIKNEAPYRPASPATWDSVLADAVFYDGVNYWCSPVQVPLSIVNDYAVALGPGVPPSDGQWNQPYTTVTTRTYGCRYKAGLGPDVWMNKWQYENNGLLLGFINPAGAPAAGEEITFNLTLKAYRLYYLNPVVNSLSRYSMPPAGGVELKLYGVGFHIGNTELEDTTYNIFNAHPPGGWKDDVYHIQFEGLQGQGNYLLHSFAGDFTVDSNIQITIPAAKMPALPLGSYQIYLTKDRAAFEGSGPGVGSANAYAGDWRCKADGRLYPGTRLTFTVGIPGPGKKKPTVFSKWRFKKYGGGIDRYYAPIDTISPAVFYDGRILAMSALTRAISDKGGLYTSSDMDVELANSDKEFSKLLAEYFLKNQIVELFYGWADQPESWKTAASVLIVDDYSRPGSVFKARLRDITTKYFKRKIPLYRINLTEYPNAHKNVLNKPMPEVLGNATYAIAGQGGAIEALCIDTINYKWMAARGSLQEITAVYIDGGLCTAGPPYYTISYDDGGRTYININPILCTTDAKVTFNAKGYSYAPWDSAGGFVQNPAYILGFFLSFLVEVPEDYLDFDSLDALAAKFTADGEDTSGFLVLQGEQDSETITEELLFTMGAQSAFDRSGRFYVERKDLSVLATSLFIFSQIDTLGHPDFNHNLKSAINRMRYRWTYSPAGDTYAGGDVAIRQSSIIDFEQELESADFIDFKWTTSSTWAAKRAEEELLKWGYGQPKITFELPLAWIDDIDVLTNFRLQDPFGLSRTGAGEQGRYCYVTSFSADLLGAKIGIEAGDLSWILRQYLFLGDETDLPAAWANATDEQRIFAYLCDEITGRFADGEPGKKLADENMI